MAEISTSTYSDDIRAVAALDLPWEKFRGCNILITGATGLIGSCLVEVLMSRDNKDYHVFASGRNKNRAYELFAAYMDDPMFHFIYYDVILPLDCDINFDYIVHAASNASPNFFMEKPVEIIKSNIYGVVNLMDYGLKHGLKRFLYVSSGEVYGEGDGRIFSEEYSGYVDCTKPRSCYPSSKRAAETLCAAYSSEFGIDVVIARPSHNYGPHFTESDNRVYAQFIRNALRGEDIVMKSNGLQFRSWCYVVDCTSALFYILLKGVSGQAYNIADSTSNVTIKHLAETVAAIGGCHVVMESSKLNEQNGFNPVSKSVFDTTKLINLGWTISGTLENKLRKVLSYLRCTSHSI